MFVVLLHFLCLSIRTPSKEQVHNNLLHSRIMEPWTHLLVLLWLVVVIVVDDDDDDNNDDAAGGGS
jgi:hypothetical protein